jgi:hypothetical protein
MTKPRARLGLQHDAIINRRQAFNILGQPKRAGKIKPCRRIEAQNQPISRFLGPIGHRVRPIHHHPTIGGMRPDPKSDHGCLLRK